VATYEGTLGTFPEDAARAWRVGGYRGLVKEIRRRGWDRVGGYVRRLVIETDLSQLGEIAPPVGVDIRPFTWNDWSLLGDMARHRLVPEFDEAAARGRICLVAWRQRQAVGYAWFSDTIESRHESEGLLLPDDATFVWEVEVSRDEHDVAAALMRAGLWLARERGFRRSWMIGHPDNVATLCTVAEVAPSSVLGTVARVKVLAWVRSWYRGLSSPVPIRALVSR